MHVYCVDCTVTKIAVQILGTKNSNCSNKFKGNIKIVQSPIVAGQVMMFLLVSSTAFLMALLMGLSAVIMCAMSAVTVNTQSTTFKRWYHPLYFR